jgi:hypothetical protein
MRRRKGEARNWQRWFWQRSRSLERASVAKWLECSAGIENAADMHDLKPRSGEIGEPGA